MGDDLHLDRDGRRERTDGEGGSGGADLAEGLRTSLYPAKSRSMSTRKLVTSPVSRAHASFNTRSTLVMTAWVWALMS